MYTKADDARHRVFIMVMKTHLTCYTAYGYTPSTLGSSTGFNGQYRMKPLEQYALGAGYRLYSPSIKRFISADSLSPFGNGGFNAYAYCAGDPVNRIDPTGQSWLSPFKGLANRLGLRTPSSQRRKNPPSYDETRKRFTLTTRRELDRLDKAIHWAQDNFLLSTYPAQEERWFDIKNSLIKERDKLWNDNAHQPWLDRTSTQVTPPPYAQIFPNAPEQGTSSPSMSQTIMHNVRAAR